MSAKVAFGWSTRQAVNGYVSGITYVGQSHWPATRGGDPGTTLPRSITPPGGMAADDFVIVIGWTETNVQILGGPWAVSAAAGQTWSSPIRQYNAGEGVIFSCKFNGSWSGDPSFTHDGFTSPASSLDMYVFRGVHPTTPWDDGPYVTIDTVNNVSQPIPKGGEHAWATSTANALAVCAIALKDIVGSVTIDSGFVAADGGSDIYWNADGTPNAYNNHDLTTAFARKAITSPGSVSATMTLSGAVGNGVLIYGALRPA